MTSPNLDDLTFPTDDLPAHLISPLADDLSAPALTPWFSPSPSAIFSPSPSEASARPPSPSADADADAANPVVVHHHHHHHHHGGDGDAARAAQAAAQAEADAAARMHLAAMRPQPQMQVLPRAPPAAVAAVAAAVPAVPAEPAALVVVPGAAVEGRLPGAAVASSGGRAGAGLSAAQKVKAEKAIARKRGNNTHTRRCRKKVNDKFDELLSILPPPDDPKAQPVKHKAQILAYSIMRIREISSRNHYLELMLAMSNRDALTKWIDRVVTESSTLAQALEPFMELLCTTRSWKYAELWAPASDARAGRRRLGRIGGVEDLSSSSSAASSAGDNGGVTLTSGGRKITSSNCSDETHTIDATATAAAGARTGTVKVEAACGEAAVEAERKAGAGEGAEAAGEAVEEEDVAHLRYVSSSMPRSLPEQLSQRLRRYRDHSKLFKFEPRRGVPGRVYLTKRPEWLPWLTDPVAFPRSPHALEFGVKLTFAVPVLIEDEVRMVVEFYDSDSREYDPDILNVASDIAGLIGKAFAARHECDASPLSSAGSGNRRTEGSRDRASVDTAGCDDAEGSESGSGNSASAEQQNGDPEPVPLPPSSTQIVS